MENVKSVQKAIAKLRDLNDNHELSAEQRRALDAAIEELEVATSRQGRITAKAIQHAIFRIALWTLFDDVF